MMSRQLFCCFLVLLLDFHGGSAVKYKLKVKTEDGKYNNEEVDIDTKNQTEIFHEPKGDIVLDFKKKLMMVRLPETRSCFLSESTENVPKPADLKKLLKSKLGIMAAKKRPELKFEVKGTLDDSGRSKLNVKMVELCKGFRIYLVAKVDKAPTDLDQPMEQAPAKRTKRHSCYQVCHTVSKRKCFLFFCSTYHKQKCSTVCRV